MNVNPSSTNIILYCKKHDETVRYYRDRMRLEITFATDWFVEFGLNEMSRLSIADEKHASIKSCLKSAITLSLKVEDIQRIWIESQTNGLEPTPIDRHP